jgi:hypothetical protein
MGLIHTPRTLYAIAKGLWKRRQHNRVAASANQPATIVGIGEGNHHIYEARLGLFDVDYLGHMNNGTQQ